MPMILVHLSGDLKKTPLDAFALSIPSNKNNNSLTDNYEKLNCNKKGVSINASEPIINKGKKAIF